MDRARVIAERAADAAIKRHGITKGFGQREALINAAMPMAQCAVRIEGMLSRAANVIASNDQVLADLKVISDRVLATSDERLSALEAYTNPGVHRVKDFVPSEWDTALVERVPPVRINGHGARNS